MRRLVHAEHERAEAARVEDARARQHLGVAGAGVLRQVADLAGAVDAAAGRQRLAGERLRERGLAGAVAADEPHLVARRDAEVHVLHEHAGADADLEIMDGEHGDPPAEVGG